MTVSELNEKSKTLLETTFAFVEVEGEISRFVANKTSGHWYFTLKDEKSAVSCSMFKFANARAKFVPNDGMKVKISGKVSLYPTTGTYQIIVSNIAELGEGDLELAFNALKEKLANEGLFDSSHKKSLPNFPRKIALITSLTSAAYQDMLRVAKDRFAFIKISAFNALMQGENSPKSVIKALKFADNQGFDAIVIARGGGSKEDLWCFNDESLARAIFAAKTPIISAIGHEIDFSICDFVADHRALTPTAAMVDLLPDIAVIYQDLDTKWQILNGFMDDKILSSENLLKIAELNLKSKALSQKLQNAANIVDNLEYKFKNFINVKFQTLYQESVLKEEILNAHAKFFEQTKDLVSLQKDGRLINLNDLKSGDKVVLSSQDTSKTAIIE